MRRRLLLSLGGAASAAAILRNGTARAQAQNWPDRPVKLLLPYAPGGATDLMGRPWAEKLSQAFGQQFVIENRGGAGGMIGTEAAAKSPPDGYTLFFAPGATLTTLPILRKTPYDPIKSFTPIARMGDLVCGFVINPAAGPKTLHETIAYAKQNPGKLAFGSAGLGTSSQMRIEMLKFRAKVDILHVPYRGSADALNDLLPNTVQMMNEINVLPHVKAGKLILLNINYPTRHPEFPDVATLTELGLPDSDVPVWFSLLAPAGTPMAIVEKLNAKAREIAASDDMKARMRAINVVIPLQSPEQIAQHLVADIAATGNLIRDANIKLE
ncbi:MAG: tripartite tricarboxylate transporter substrate binding protein [Acetobacteraceae bacterium]|nr:tripartite tricarboxylate transporter substrate binding protein [Acetobacteraceae bacterium]